jgi:hypothetical protein
MAQPKGSVPTTPPSGGVNPTANAPKPAPKAEPPQSAAELARARSAAGGGGRAAAVAGAALISAAIAGGATLASLFGKSNTPDPFNGMGPLSFPNDLQTMGHWVEFQAYETKGIGTDLLQKAGFGSKINGGRICLPMPANLSTDYNPEYTPGELGSSASGEILAAGDRAIYGNNNISAGAAAGGALAGAGAGALAGVIGSIVGSAGGAVGAAASGALGATDNTGAAALKILGGVAQNPHKIVLFTGVNFREHQFAWRLSPRNRNESNAIKMITDMFAYYAHPEFIMGSLFFKYPEYFSIKFRHPEYLFQLEPSVLKDIRVNYHSQGVPAYIRDEDGGGPPAPAEIELSLTFMETEIITKDKLQNQLSVNLPRGRYISEEDGRRPQNTQPPFGALR